MFTKPAILPLAASLLLGASNGFAQSQIVNAQLTTRQAARGLDDEIQAVAAQGTAAWVAYRVATVPGPQHMCNSWSSMKVMLEPATELTILVRVDNRRIEKLQAVTPECEVDAGGLPVVWLNGISPAQSASWLTQQIKSSETSGQREPKMVDAALRALIWHPGNEPINTVVALARDDRRPYVRSQALFWLAQRAGDQAVATIRGAIDNDPETEVKRKAVFALSQLPKAEGVPMLIDIARTNRNPAVRKQAMFWLGQSKDTRAITFFEQVLRP